MKFLTILSVLLFAATLSILSSCGKGKQAQSLLENTSQQSIGAKFEMANIIDSSGKDVTLDFRRSKLTLIDFWHRGCPPCIEELNKLEPLLKGHEKEITFYSISINQFWYWQPLFASSDEQLSFLKHQLPNWKQYNLKTSDDPKFRNQISADRLKEILIKFETNTYPVYLVLDSTGSIIARPASAVVYIESIQ